MEKIGIIIQARLGSTRFPKKVLSKFKNLTLLEILLKRLKPLKNIKKIIATTDSKEDNELVNLLKRKKIEYFRGAKNNLISRYYKCAKKHRFNTILRITGDCPLIDYRMINKMIEIYKKKKLQFLSNNDPPTFPDGLDIEIFDFKILEKAYFSKTTRYEQEHICPYFKKLSLIKKFNYKNHFNYEKLRLTVDYEKDLEIIFFLINYFNNLNFSFEQIIKVYKKNKKIFSHNFLRNEGSLMSNDQKKWKRAQDKIVGGNMLLSKNPDRFLPTRWPAYYKKSKGCFIWDLDGKKYLDLCLMGVGTNILGYANHKINKKVIEAIHNGNMSSSNCVEELQLSEKILEMNSWAGKVKFAKTGGEANTIAIRIARSYSKKHNIAFCGYHGWHDWYLSANFKKKNNLDQHHLKGLKPKGVHKNLKNTSKPFTYNNFSQLNNLIKNDKKIGIIIMEVERNIKPNNNFLKKVRKLADRKKLILIFDECTSGFRETYGGLYKKYDVIPDIVVYGKALGNGYPITCVVGKKEIMNSAENSFISSTFWSDRVGYVAALETLKEMHKLKSWKKITKLGKYVKNQWLRLAKKHKLKILIQGIDAMPSFKFINNNNEKFISFISQEMIKQGILATNTIYLCINHNKSHFKKYFKILDKVFFVLFKCSKNLGKIDELLDFPAPIKNFDRLN